MNVERYLPGEPASIPRARRFVAESLPDVSSETLETLVLIVSELATNCIQHARSGFRVKVSRDRRQVRLEVTDTGDGTARLRNPTTSELHGRGLRIVDALADRWGVTPASPRQGKTVWFTLAT